MGQITDRTASTQRQIASESRKIKHTKSELLEALAQTVAQRDASNAKLAEMAAELQDVKGRLATALTDAQALAAVRPCSPGGKPAAEALQPLQDGIMYLWACVRGEGYKIGFGGQDAGGKRWFWTKFTTGEKYTLTETDAETITCTCPGGQKYGPRCAGGRGCKHVRQLRAARALLSNIGPTYTATPPAVAKTPQAIIDEEHDDCFAGVKAAA